MRSGGVGPSGMWYFAYGSNLNSRAVAEWCRHYGYRAPALRPGQPAVLNNYRLSFPIFSEYWGGGIGDIVYDPGKYVMGALFDLSDAEILVLDAKVNRKLDGNNKEIGIYKRIEVKVSHSGKSDLIPAITYQGISVERYHIPPTQHYMDLVIQGAYTFGLSMMWIAYLQSFPRQQGRKPRPPGTGDAAAKL
jgi:AIG2-like family